MEVGLATFETAPARLPVHARRTLEIVAFVCLLAVNWILAVQTPSMIFSYTSLLLFVWLGLLMVRIHPRATVLALPLLITRAATLVSLICIEAGSPMPEIGRVGVAGDASASFTAFTALFFLSYGLMFAAGERAVMSSVTSPLLARLVAISRWPVIGLCAVLCVLALVQGLRTGFPVFEHVDRFYYRRYYGQGLIVNLLDFKFLLGALLGAVAFGPSAPRLASLAAIFVQLALLGTFFLFGDKFFTMLTMMAYFLTPYLLTHQPLLRTLIRGWLVAAVLLAAAFGATLFIYCDYGNAPLETGMTKLGSRIAGQGELWFVATQDNRQWAAYDSRLVRDYTASLTGPDPAAQDFATGVETFFFINRYTPQPLRRSFHRNQGWVQLTMGGEAMALAGFGYVGVEILMVLGGALAALPALYLRRAFASQFPLSVALGLYMSLQVYTALQQAALWPVLSIGSLRRFLLIFVFELLLFGLNRMQTRTLGRRVITAREPPGPVGRERRLA